MSRVGSSLTRSGAAPRPASPETQGISRAKANGCCLRSCLGCSILVVLLAAVLVFAWLRYGSPWVARQKQLLVERFPVVGEVLSIESALPFQGVTLTGGASGATLRTDFPADVWLPRDVEDEVFNTTPEMALAVLGLRGVDPAGLAARARKEMTARGWRRTPVPDPHDGIALVFERDDRVTSMKIFAVDSGVELWVRSW